MPYIIYIMIAKNIRYLFRNWGAWRSLYIWNNWQYMMVQPPQTHNHGKYDNGKGQYLRFDDNNEMSDKYILSTT